MSLVPAVNIEFKMSPLLLGCWLLITHGVKSSVGVESIITLYDFVCIPKVLFGLYMVGNGKSRILGMEKRGTALLGMRQAQRRRTKSTP